MTISAQEQTAIDAFMSTLNAGQAYYKAGEWDNAVETYKAAGNDGATNLGPVIDQATSGQSASLTQKAWTLNGQLATVNSGPYNGTAATKADADKAFALIQQIYTAYHDALYPTAKPGAYVPTGSSPAAVVASAVTGASGSTSTSWLPLIGGALIGAAIGNVFGLAAAVVGAIVGGVAGSSVGKKGTA